MLFIIFYSEIFFNLSIQRSFVWIVNLTELITARLHRAILRPFVIYNKYNIYFTWNLFECGRIVKKFIWIYILNIWISPKLFFLNVILNIYIYIYKNIESLEDPLYEQLHYKNIYLFFALSTDISVSCDIVNFYHQPFEVLLKALRVK